MAVFMRNLHEVLNFPFFLHTLQSVLSVYDKAVKTQTEINLRDRIKHP